MTLDDRIRSVRRRVTQIAAERDVAVRRARELTEQAQKARASATDHSEALPLVISIVRAFRKSSIDRLEKPGSAALRAVFERNYGFCFEQEERRGQVELTPMVVALDGKPVPPVDSMGGGMVDVVSLTLRPVLWGEQPKRSDPVMVLDEPAHAVNSEHGVRNLSRVFRKLSKTMGLQYIIVTNRPLLAAAADRIFNLTNPTDFDTQIEVVTSGEAPSHGQT